MKETDFKISGFEIDVILDEYQTFKYEKVESEQFEIDVILDEYQTNSMAALDF